MGACCDSEQPAIQKEIDLANKTETNTSQDNEKKVYGSDVVTKPQTITKKEEEPLIEHKPEERQKEKQKETTPTKESKTEESKTKPPKSDESTPLKETYEKKEEKKEEVKYEEIKMNEIDVIDRENKLKSIFEAFTDNHKYFDLRDPFEFILDLGKGSKLTSIDVKYKGRYSSSEIIIYASYSDDNDDNNWIEIGSLKLNDKPENNAIININNIINYSNRRYIKIIFCGEFYSTSYVRIDRFYLYGIGGIKRKEITNEIKVIDGSGIRDNDKSKYGYERMFTTSDRESWETPKGKNHWIILDTKGYIISKIDIEFYSSSYTCDNIEIYEGINLKSQFELIKDYNWQFKTKKNRKNEDEPLSRQSITFDNTEMGNLIKHKRLIKMKFIRQKEEKNIEITFLKFYGELGENGELENEEFLYDWQEMKDENENQFEQDENAIDLTQSHLIKILETYPITENKDKKDLKLMYRAEPNGYWRKRLDNNKKDVWLKFDMGPIKIDSFDIGFPESYHAKTIKVYTSKINSNIDVDINWNLIKIKRNIKKEEIKTFYLKSNHQKYIKIAIADRDDGYVAVNKLKWSGFEPIVEDEITNKIKIYQCSGKTDECKAVFKNNLDTWESSAGEKAWIIFDCGKYELDRLSITFADKSKPEIVKLRMSDVAPAYSFKIPSIMKWKLNTTQSFEDEKWQDIALVEDLALIGNEYDKVGFKRYIQLELSKFQINEMQIIKIQFFGNLSQRIDVDDEQFDSVLDGDGQDEKKQDSSAPHKPEFIDSSPSMQGYTLENIWKKEDHFFWMSQFGIPPFIILDLGNNQNNIKEILIKAYQYYPYKTLKLSTSNKVKAKDWTLLFQDDEMESKMDTGGLYDLTKYDVKGYIKMEFEELKMNMFAMASVKLYGDSEFFDKKERVITIDDIKNMKHIDEDLIHEYREQEQKKVTVKMGTYSQKIRETEQDEKTGKLSDEWINAKTEYYNNQAKFYYMFTELYAYQAATIYEQEQLMKIMVIQKTIAEEEIKKILDCEIDYTTEDKAMEEEEKKAKEEYEESVKDKTVDATVKAELQQKWKGLVKLKKEKTTEYYSEFSKKFTELSGKCYAMYSNEKDAKVYECWKEAIENHPRQISSLYNVQEYQQMQSYARKKDPDGFKKSWGVLADLFDQSLEQEKELLHRFFVFQLSANYWEARTQSYGRPPVTVLFDCGDEFSRKVNRLEFKIPSPCNINRIVVSTAGELREEKLDSAEADDDETLYDWNNFNIIGQMIVDDKLKGEKKDNGLNYEDTKIVLDYKNERYIRVEFTDWDEGHTDLEIERVNFFIHDQSDLVDEDQKENGLQLSKYKLNMVKDNKTEQRKDGWRGIGKAYKIDSGSCYRTSDDIKEPYLIFDCETRKVEKVEVRFDSTSWSQFDTISISTTNDFDPDGTDSKSDDGSGWTTIFEEQGQFESYSDRDKFKTILIDSKNERYLKFSFVLTEESDNLNLNHLKFYTIDPPEYKWDIDENIKNLTYKIKILTATKCLSSRVVENILSNDRKYCTAAYGVNHKESIEDRIRDKVCYGVNLLRKSRGGKISSHDKHFIKFLLCFQNERNYNEMLYSSKLVMNILRRPLDIEYNRLQSINSGILTLHVDEKDECKDVKSMHVVLEWDYNKWYKVRKAMFWPDDLKPLVDEWTKLGLTLTDPEFKQIRRKGMLEVEKSFCSAEDLAMEYINLIAYRLDPSFQKSMKSLFEENRKKLNLQYPPDSNDLGVQSGPVKTKARQKIKIILKYFNKPSPQCMSVLDIVRCAIVCDDDVELCSLFELIMNKFSGSIMRVKNAFDDIKKGEDSHGYRAVMINIVYGDEKLLPKGFKFVCEAQLLLNKYYQIRKDMHLGYGICRSEDGGVSQNKQPHYVLAQDSCKFGKLDI